MEDTSPENRELVRQIVALKSVEERVLMCAAMYEDAKGLATVGMPMGLSAEEQKAYVFRRLHGADPEEIVQGE